jgi:aspartate aminotransferase-like enzyme
MRPEVAPAHLFLPGPTPVPADVALAQALPMVDHRGDAFGALMADLLPRLARLFGTAGGVAVLPASGTGGLEAALVNLFSPGERVLAVVAGAFGARWAEMAADLGLVVDRLEVAWGEAASPSAVAGRVADQPYAGVLLTQNETSTGVLQDVESLAAAVRAQAPETLVAVDAVSGFPAVALPMDAWGVDLVVAGSQKAFALPPGLALVAVGERARQAVEASGRRRAYFDLRPYLRGDLPYTAPVGLWYALERSLARLEGEGAERRERRHRLVARMVREGARALGLRPLAREEVASPTVTALTLPEGVEPAAVRAAAGRLGAAFAGGMGPLRKVAVRVGHVGAVGPLDAVAAVAALEAALAEVRGQPADGAAAAAAVRAWRGGAADGLEAAGQRKEGART